MSPKSRSIRCCSPGILQNCKNDSQTQSQRCRKKLKIRIHDPSRPTEQEKAQEEQRRFEELKKQYFDKCSYINKNLVIQCAQSSDSDNDPDMQVLKTIRGNPKEFNLSKNGTTKNHQDATTRRKRNSRVTNEEIPPRDVQGRIIKRGCGAPGCECLNCVCDVNCQIDCQCMRKI